MPKLDAFSQQLVDMVRQMPDEAILELVRHHLAAGSGWSGGGRVTPVGTPSAVTSATSKRRRRSAEEREELQEAVRKAIVAGEGMSLGEVTAAVGGDKPQVAAAIKALKAAGKVKQAGDRRFARYAKSKAVALKASKAARKR